MSSIKKNFAYQTVYQILIIILPLFTSPYISRVLGVSGLGRYSYTYSVAYYFGIFILLGVNSYGTREIAKCKKEKKALSKKFFDIYAIQFCLGVILTCLYVLYAVKSDDKVIALIQTFYVVSVVMDVNWFFFGIEDFKVTVTRNIIVKLCCVAGIFMFVRGKEDLPVYTFIMAGSAFVSQLILWVMLCKKLCFCLPENKDVWQHFKPMWILFIPTIIISIYKIMDKIMIGILANKNQLAFYENADKIMSIPLGVITALGTIMMPRISSMVQGGNTEKVQSYIRNSMKFSMFSASALAFGLAAVGRDFAPIFFGKAFAYSGELITYLSVTVIFISWSNVIRMQYLLPFNMEKVYIVSSAVGAVINFIINILLIPRIGAMGAVYGTVAAEFAVTLYQTIGVRKCIPIFDLIKDNVFYVLNGIVMLITIFMVFYKTPNSIAKLIMEIALGGLYYILTSTAYILLFDKKLLKDLLTRRK